MKLMSWALETVQEDVGQESRGCAFIPLLAVHKARNCLENLLLALDLFETFIW